MDIYIKKKTGNLELWNPEKILSAIKKSADRIASTFNEGEQEKIVILVEKELKNHFEGTSPQYIKVETVHSLVENALEKVRPDIARSYKDYRNWVKKNAKMMADVTAECNTIQFIGDKSNSNADSQMVSTKRIKKLDVLETMQYQEYFLNEDERAAAASGYIYIHDKGARQDTMNCCIFDMEKVLSGGFEMGNIWYNEPKTLATAFDVIGDITLMAASQQYGGFSIPEVDRILEPYAEKSYQKYLQEYKEIMESSGNTINEKNADKYATKKVIKDIKQGFQGWEYKFNTVASSRGDYPFLSVTFGLCSSKWGKELSKGILETRKNGQGKEGFKKPVLFPKLIFLYDENLHGPGKPLEDVFETGIACSAKTMYPDWLSLTGKGYIASMYKQYGKVVSPMGCVDGKELITYKWNQKLYIESFERMWNRLSQVFVAKHQRYKNDPNLYIDPNDVEIYDTQKGFVKVNRVIRNLSTDWRNIKFSNGRQLLCTADHPFEIKEKGIVYASDLSVGKDKLLINSSQYYEENKVIDSEYAWMMGLLLCDGCYKDNIIRISIAAETEDEIEKRFIKIAKNHFGYETKTTLQQRGIKGNYKDIAFIANKKDNTLKELGEEFASFFGGYNKNNRQIPNEVFEWNHAAKLAFMAGIIDADGYVNHTSHGGSVIQIGSTNKELALQQMALAQALGYPAKIYSNYYKKGSNNVRYRVEFFAEEELINALSCEKKRINFKEPVNSHYNTEAIVTEITEIQLDNPIYSYDVSTDSEHFEVSGIYSHNCRAFLSPWYERGGMHPADENDIPVFVGRFNLGVISLHLPMILAKARRESKDFYEVLDYYLQMIRKIHLRTYEYLGHMKASMNSLGFCEGGFYGGNLNLDDKIAPVLKSATASFGITALNELQVLYNGKSIAEDGAFALEVMEYINQKITEFKEKDGKLYALYGTPAESLCSKQIEQFRKEFGIIDGVSDRPYVSNSFHCHVTEDITPIQKQDLENRFWELLNGGKIQYVKYPLRYNIESIRTMVRRAMEMGLYEGVNLSLAYCDDCGYEELEMDVCPKCGSHNLTKIERMNGYLSYSRIHGDTRLNAGKMAEIADRVSM